MVFFDGNSSDGTLEIIREHQKGEHGHKIKLFENKDPKDLQADYERLSNECMAALDTEVSIFLHPDMFPDGPQSINLPGGAIAATIRLRSFAGDPGAQLYEIAGRGEKWKNIYRLRNPNLGAHYHGHYGAQNEDIYFSEITGTEYKHYGQDFNSYPYLIVESGIKVLHYSDVRPRYRRIERMIRCLENQGFATATAVSMACSHPRVSFKDGQGLIFNPIDNLIELEVI